MDSLITAAARALAAGDPLGALEARRAARRPAGAGAARHRDGAARRLVRARRCCGARRARFGPREAVARARCVVAEAEIALVLRDLGWPAQALDAARATLEAHGDRVNAAHARLSRGAPPAAARPARRGRARARRARPGAAAADLARRRTSWRRRHRDAAAADAAARAALARAGARGARGRHPGADGRGRGAAQRSTRPRRG